MTDVKRDGIIHYPASKLKSQWDCIARCRLNALKKISQDSHCRLLGLDRDDPRELWRYVVGRRRAERLPDLAKDKKANARAARVRELDPEISVDPEVYRKFRELLGAPTLAETVLALGKRCRNDSQLEQHVVKLLMLRKKCLLQKRGAVGFDRTALLEFCKLPHKNEADLASRLAKLLGLRNKGMRQEQRLKSKISDFMCNRWIEDPPPAELLTNNWTIDPRKVSVFQRSLCFFSDRAMATLIHYLFFKEWLERESSDTEQKRARKLSKLEVKIAGIKKLYQRLKLRPAKPRAIRELEMSFGNIYFIPFDTRRP